MSINLNMTTPYHKEIFSYEETIILYVTYAVATTTGILSNLLVCFLIIRNKYLWTIVNLLILNLAVSDIIACFSVYPFIYFRLRDNNSLSNPTASVLCGFSEGLYGFFVCATVSLITLSVLSISRYLGINHPLKVGWKLSKRKLKWVLVFAWALSISLLIPNALSFSYDEKLELCIRSWAHGVNPLVYFTFTGILGVFLPLSSLTFTYLTSLYTLWFKDYIRKKERPSTTTPPQINHKGSLRVKKRVVKLLGVLVLIYLLCWSPFASYWLMSVVIGEYTVGNFVDERKSIRTTRLTIFFAVCNTVLNPIVYAFTSKQLRGAFRLMVGMKSNGAAPSNAYSVALINNPAAVTSALNFGVEAVQCEIVASHEKKKERVGSSRTLYRTSTLYVSQV